MNSECSIWRVLIFSVNFAPGYPRRYPDLRGLLTAITMFQQIESYSTKLVLEQRVST